MKLRLLLLGLVVGIWGCPEEEERNPNSITVVPIADTGASDMGDGGADAGDTGRSDAGGDAGETPDMRNDRDLGGDMAPEDMCVPETDAEMCARYMFECGPLQNLDNCGQMRTIESCGDEATVCDEFETCGAGGIPGQCGCMVATCADLGVLCGEVSDSCGGILTCDLFCVDQVSAGAAHNCAIGSGKLKCWGKGGDGALGTGNTTTQKNPVDVTGLTTTVNQVAAGGHHTCVIDSAQRVVCWGKNDRSQLGIGTTVNSNRPGTAAINAGADQIVAGQEHTCARSGDKLECWGSNEFGQIGDAAFNINANVGVPSVPTGLGAGVVTVAAGKDHTCVIQNDATSGQNGVLKCWGRNHFAQTAPLPITGTTVDGTFQYFAYLQTPGWDLSTMVVEPTVVNDAGGAPFTGVKAVAAGEAHTCIVDSSDQLWCWGFMPGFDPPTSCPKPDNKTVSECGIFPRTTGIVVGQGTLNMATMEITLQSIKGMPVANEPRLMELNGKIPVELAAGNHHQCARVSNPDQGQGNIFCWGNSAFGQIGDGTNNHWTQPRQVIAATDGDIVNSLQIELGGVHSCALADDNSISCWGSNGDSQIGNSNLLRDETYRPFDVLLQAP